MSFSTQDAAELGKLRVATERIADQQRDALAAASHTFGEVRDTLQTMGKYLAPVFTATKLMLDGHLRQQTANTVALRDLADAVMELASPGPKAPPVVEPCPEGEHDWVLHIGSAFGAVSVLRCNDCGTERPADEVAEEAPEFGSA